MSWVINKFVRMSQQNKIFDNWTNIYNKHKQQCKIQQLTQNALKAYTEIVWMKEDVNIKNICIQKMKKKSYYSEFIQWGILAIFGEISAIFDKISHNIRPHILGKVNIFSKISHNIRPHVFGQQNIFSKILHNIRPHVFSQRNIR